MTNIKILSSVMRDLPFFSDLNENERENLLKVVSFKKVQRGEIIFLHGDPLTHLYWICDGAIQMFRSTCDGHEITTSINNNGDLLFDPNALQLKQNHTMSARAVKDSTLLSISATWMIENMKKYDNLSDKFITILAKRAQEAMIEVEHQATMNAAQLISCFLQHLCVSHGLSPSGFKLPYSKSLIASRLGMELESFSRTLPKLKAFGITVDGKYVSFDNVTSVQKHSCSSCSSIEDCPTNKAIKNLSSDLLNAKQSTIT